MKVCTSTGGSPVDLELELFGLHLLTLERGVKSKKELKRCEYDRESQDYLGG
jgi:hypothetical protein